MSHLSLALLGTPIIQHGGRTPTFRTRKALALLIYLAVEGGMHSREQLTTLFWPESGESEGRTTLRSTLAYLRNALEDQSSTASPGNGQERRAGDHLIIEREALGFNLNADLTADWLTLQAAWTVARSPVQLLASDKSPQPGDRPALAAFLVQLQIAANLYRGDFLAGFSLEDAPDFDDWASTQRETYHRQMSLIFDKLSQLQAEGGELVGAIETTVHWIAHDPLNEVAHRRLMQLHFAAEDRAAALRAYGVCRATFIRELNAEPSPETEALADRIRMKAEGGRLALSKVEGMKAEAPTSSSSFIPHPSSFRELPLVGRANEHLALVTAYRIARRGQPQVVTLEGEPGIGKTRLAMEFLGWATAQGADVLQGRAFETSGRLPYQPLIEALRDRLERENAPDDLLSDVWLAELSRLLPELRERYPDLPLPTAEETTVQTRLFEAVTRLAQALAQRTPSLVLFLDDLQWADAASLDLLQYASRRWAATSSPLLLLFTVRAEELEGHGDSPFSLGLGDWLANLGRDIPLTRLRLEPLTLKDTQRLVQALGAEPAPSGGEVGNEASPLAQFSQRLFAETGGQPFFMVETLKTLFEPNLQFPNETATGERSFDQVVADYLREVRWPSLPDRVQEVIRARLAHLSPAAQTACLAAAVLGGNFDFEQLCDVAGLAESDGLPALEELLKRGLMREQRPATAHPYVLAHDKIREAVYARMGEARRRIFHRRALAALEAIAAPPAQLAQHALAASLSERALDLSILAGEEAMRLFAARDAIEHFSHAFEVAGQLSLTPPPRLYRARGKAYEALDEFDAAMSDYQLGLTRAQASGDRQGEWRALLDVGFLWASRDFARARNYFQQALELARALNEPATLAHSLNRVGNWYVNVEQPFEALRYHQEALAIFEELNDRRGLAQTTNLLGMAHFICGDLAQSAAYYAQAVGLFRELDDRQGLFSSLTMLALRGVAPWVEVPIANLAEGVRDGELALQLAREMDWRSGEAEALLSLGLCRIFQGDYGRALNVAQGGLAIVEEIEHRLWMAFAHCVLGIIHLDLLALPAARQHLEQALALAHEAGTMIWGRNATAFLALVYILQNEHALAESILNAVLGPDQWALDSLEWRFQTSSQRLIWWTRAELALAQGQPHLALQIVERLITFAANISAERPILRLSKLRGEALAALNRVAEAEATLREAQAAAQTQGASPLLWRIHLALGKLYQAQEHQAQAEREFSVAWAIIEELAATIPDGSLRSNFLEGALSW